MKYQKLSSTILALLVIVLLTLIVGLNGQQSQAAPPAAPTPVADILQAREANFFRFQGETALTASTNTSGIDVMKLNSLDIHTIIDAEGTNATTITIQYSNDNTNWADGDTVLAAVTTDQSDITRLPVFGRYARFKQDLSNTLPITITILAVGRQ